MNELKRLRLNAGVSVDALSTATGVPVTTIYNLERGDIRNPRLDNLKALAGYFGIKPGDLAAALHTQPEAA
jgi:transcriptional regulator with XRE-family HTH domain